MAIQINEVIVRAIVSGDDNSRKKEKNPSLGISEEISGITKDELLELIKEVINVKKER
jgi:hypothetical protein